MTLRAVIFDFDFTLVDSSRGFIESHAHACAALGLPPIADVQAMAMMGTPLHQAFRASFETEHHHLADDYVRHWQARADEVMTGLTEMFAEAPATVMALRAAGLKTGIVSQKRRHRIETVLRRDGMFEAFDVIIGGDDMRAFKPDPEGILKATDHVGVTAAEAALRRRYRHRRPGGGERGRAVCRRAQRRHRPRRLPVPGPRRHPGRDRGPAGPMPKLVLIKHSLPEMPAGRTAVDVAAVR